VDGQLHWTRNLKKKQESKNKKKKTVSRPRVHEDEDREEEEERRLKMELDESSGDNKGSRRRQQQQRRRKDGDIPLGAGTNVDTSTDDDEVSSFTVAGRNRDLDRSNASDTASNKVGLGEVELISTNVTPPVDVEGGRLLEGAGGEDDWNQGEAYALMDDSPSKTKKKPRGKAGEQSFDDEKGQLMLPEEDVRVTVVGGRDRTSIDDIYSSRGSVDSTGRPLSSSSYLSSFSGALWGNQSIGGRSTAQSMREGSIGFVGQFKTGEDDEGRQEAMTFVEAQHAQPSRCLPQNFLVEIEATDLEYVASLPFKDKYRWFLHQTAAMKQGWDEGHIELIIRREHILEDSVNGLHDVPVVSLNQSMRIKFKGEPAIDAGGLEREWFQLFSDELFDEMNGLFRVTHVENQVQC
jgi:hypothetical protein